MTPYKPNGTQRLCLLLWLVAPSPSGGRRGNHSSSCLPVSMKSGSVCDVARFTTYRTMDTACESRPRKCTLDQNDCVSLLDILISFNAPINEEHAWALCFQCAKCFKNAFESDRNLCKVVSDLDHVILHREGYVHPNTIFSGGGITPDPAENSGK